jgi:uncharacterized coiled-coil protein SlyX
MKGHKHMKTITNIIYAVFALFAFACFALLPTAQAVVPAPDGCYPGFTTAEGCDALHFLTTGAGNTGVGWRSLFFDSTGNFNTGVGAGALVLNNGDSNTAVGAAASLLNTTGTQNTAVGTDAMVHNSAGSNNTALGAFALFNNLTGNYITALGANAGTDAAIVSNNIYINDPGFPGDENVISIGGIAASGIDFANTYIGGIFGASVNLGTALPVYVDTDGHLGTSLVNASGKKVRVRSLQPAQPQAMRGEFQKQQKRIADLEAMVAQQQKKFQQQQEQIESLTAGLQKVSAQIEASRPALQVVDNQQ